MPAAVPGSLMRGKKIRARATIKLGGTGCTGLTGRARALSSPVLHPPPGLSEGNTPTSMQHPSPTAAGARLSHALLSTI